MISRLTYGITERSLIGPSFDAIVHRDCFCGTLWLWCGWYNYWEMAEIKREPLCVCCFRSACLLSRDKLAICATWRKKRLSSEVSDSAHQDAPPSKAHISLSLYFWRWWTAKLACIVCHEVCSLRWIRFRACVRKHQIVCRMAYFSAVQYTEILTRPYTAVVGAKVTRLADY